MLKWTLLAFAGALGTLTRHLVSSGIVRALPGFFPYGTVAVNVLGCFLIGLLGTLHEARSWTAEVRLWIFVGFLGGLTTFSSFAYETWALFKSQELWGAAFNLMLSLIGGFAALLLGVWVARRYLG